MNKLIKVIRFISIYGINRTISKIAGRIRVLGFLGPFYLYNKHEIGLIGCGHFQFSTAAFFLSRKRCNRFLFCYDIDIIKAKSLAKFYKIPNVAIDLKDIFENKDVKLVYIASNHASHAQYSIHFLEKGVDVFCEKPIAVNFDQFDALLDSINHRKGNFFVGYNRPHSPAIKELNNLLFKKKIVDSKFTLSCFISAHKLPDGHWYRNPEEGTRICGNVGHWIDLMIHLYNIRGYIPKFYNVQIAYSSVDEADDNIAIIITTSEGDLTSITITSRTEPFEGINETINLQYGSIIAKIDDFRTLTIWDEAKLTRRKYWPKNTGAKNSILQPFSKDIRNLNEVISSTELMLHVAEMVKNKATNQLIELKHY